VLTRDLLLYRIQKGRVRPTLLPRESPEVVALSESLLGCVRGAAGVTRGELEQELSELCVGFDEPKIAQGLVKLLVDRIEFTEPDDEARTLRETAFDAGAAALGLLAADTTPELHEARLADALESPLRAMRDRLYADLPDARPMLSFEDIDAPGLVDRWNLAQVQGLVMHAKTVEVTSSSPDLLRVRRLLRWLKFNRLVADVRRENDDWTLVVEGPAAILEMARRYGLQLAQFVAAVPVLGTWRLRAEVQLRYGAPVMLEVDERSGLVSPYERSLGHVPEEITVVVRKLSASAEGWEVDTSPQPRPVGTGALCVPDLTFRHTQSGTELAVEFFHPWHRHQLAARLDQLRVRPDDGLIVAVDEVLLKDESLRALVEGRPQTLTFKGFPSERRFKQLLARYG
jgi:predicted nuclease of restriction endonuclease-like RecB superfamily